MTRDRFWLFAALGAAAGAGAQYEALHLDLCALWGCAAVFFLSLSSGGRS